MAVRTLWQEARGEPAEGQQAVAHVIWNRLAAREWGSTLASVCLWPFQFSGWDTTDPNRKAVAHVADDDPLLSSLRSVFIAAQTEPDPTGGALFYYATSLAQPPGWVPLKIFCGQFGHQRFYRNPTKEECVT